MTILFIRLRKNSRIFSWMNAKILLRRMSPTHLTRISAPKVWRNLNFSRGSDFVRIGYLTRKAREGSIGRRKGFTLTEVLISAVVLVIALSAILAGFITTSIMGENSRDITRAISHAQYIMEEIKSTDFATIRDNGNTLWDLDSGAISSKGLTALPSESIDTSVSGETILTITVVVNWKFRNSRNQSISLTTNIFGG